MKKKLLAIFITSAALCLCLCAFTFDTNSSVRSLTKPYITTYDCTFARFGNEDLLEKYEYLTVTFLDDKQIEVSYKKNKGKKRTHVCDYVYDENTSSVTAEIGILGFKFKQSTKIENGVFAVSMPILGKPLAMIFVAR